MSQEAQIPRASEPTEPVLRPFICIVEQPCGWLAWPGPLLPGPLGLCSSLSCWAERKGEKGKT